MRKVIAILSVILILCIGKALAEPSDAQRIYILDQGAGSHSSGGDIGITHKGTQYNTTTLSPKKAKSKLTWTTSNKKVATVSSKGVVKAKKVGKAKITVTTANGKKATITITVKKK